MGLWQASVGNAAACLISRMPLERPDTGQDHLVPETAEQPVGIYIHIPFCETKCPYCSFISYPAQDPEFINSYIEALERQVWEMAVQPWVRKRKFHSLFVGGGTPSSIDPVKLSGLIAECLDAFDFIQISETLPEVTVEVNPNTVNDNLLTGLRGAGVNRISIGMQALADRMLKNIGRLHSVEDNLQAFERTRNAGFSNINLDLMYGLPYQDENIWEDSLRQAAGLSPEHFSVYELTIEPGTPFFELAKKKSLNLPAEEKVVAMFMKAREILAAEGYQHYEISNYGRSGFACRHNITYWENGNYLGLGAGAVSCFSGLRIKNEEDPRQFIKLLNRKQMPYAEAEFLSLEAGFRETVIMGLRLTNGVSVRHLESRFGLTPHKYYGKILEELMRRELITETEGRLKLTRKGMLLANRVMEQLV